MRYKRVQFWLVWNAHVCTWFLIQFFEGMG